MAVEIGALRALLSLDSAAFEKGAKRAQASMNKLQRGLTKASDRMRDVGRTMTTRVTAPIAAAVGLMARSAVRNAVEIERLSQVANAGTTEFQRFAAGARDVGIEQDKLADILKDTNDRVGDFLSTGGGPMADFFENIAPKVGVTAEQFKNLSGPQALQLYVSSLEKAGVNQQEMTFYMEAMASDATLLLPLLRNNGKEMGRLGDAAEKAGALMDAKTLKALLRTRDAMRDAGDAAKGLFNQIMASLAPVMETIAEKVGEAARWFSGLAPEMKRLIGIAAAVAAAIGPLALGLGFLATALAALASPIGLVVLALGAVAGAAAYVVTQWDSIVAKYPALGTAAERSGNALKVAWGGMQDVAKSTFDSLSSTVAGIIDLFQGDFQGAFDNFKAAFTSAGDAISASVNTWIGIIDAIVPGFRQWVDDIILTVSELPGKLYDMGVQAIQRFVNGILETWEALKESVFSIFDLGNSEAARNAVTSTEQLGRDIGAGLSRGIMSTKPSTEAEIQQYLDDVEGAARDQSETQSPSRVWMRLGQDLMDGLSVGIADGAVRAGEAAAGAMSKVADSTAPALDAMSTLKDGFKSAFSSILTGAQDFGASLEQSLRSLANNLINSGIDQLFGAIFGAIGGGSQVKVPDALLGKLASLDGGGYTGSGPRSGGVDGKGGFPAILHPQETVIDHTKGQGAANVDTQLQVNIYGAPSEPQVKRGQNGRIDIDFRKALRSEIENGSLDGAMARRFGAKAKARGA